MFRPAPPTHISGKVIFQIHARMARVTIKGTDFASVFSVTTKRGDSKPIEDAARQLWPILELIARDAVADGKIRDEGELGKPSYTIDRATLEHYAEKYSTFLEWRDSQKK